MYFLGKFLHKQSRISFNGLFNVAENIVYPIESIFHPNITGGGQNFNQLEPVLCLSPSKIVAVGKNYKDHIQEFDSKTPEEPIIFLKANNSIIGPNEEITLPKGVGKIDYEGEIAIVIKQECENISEEQAIDYILGFTCANDITARDLQKKDGQWTRAKSFRTFCPIGPWILPISMFPNFKDLSLKTFLNGKLVQSGKANQMLFKIPYLISFISKVMTLYPGDIILTGTPSGVGPIKNNSTISVEIEQIGTLVNIASAAKS